ncbi:MAG: hypothetical protein JST82_16195 [Bacteroidetes bacterium]|nr:hypothetical protein [Bacteroidota bacterium]
MRIIFLLFLLLTVNTSYSDDQHVSCGMFTNGKFKIIDKFNNTWIIHRNDDRQTEVMKGKRDTAVFIVKWINQCTYTLTPTAETFKVMPDLPSNAVFTTTIIEAKKDSYVQTTTVNFADFQLTCEVSKID